jgi:RNA polymerase sigma factor (sigma-70 family)
MLMTNSVNLQEQWEYWYPRVYGYFYKRVNDKTEVEDLTANTISTVFMAKNVQNTQAYMWKVAHNYLVKFINTKTTSYMIVALDENIDVWQPDDVDIYTEETVSSHYSQKLAQLKECIANRLSEPSDIKLIELCIYQEKNSTEVGEILHIKADTIRQKLSRLLKKLRTHCVDLWPY